MGGGHLDREIKELMEYIENSSFVEFELEREGFKIKLVKRAAGNGPAPGLVMAVPETAAAPATAASPSPAGPRPADAPDVHVLKSPIVGTFYRASAPGSRAFAEVGDRVRKGQVVCIVEAMKLMNEIESDCEGEILEILVANGQPVEYGEPLFKLRRTGSA